MTRTSPILSNHHSVITLSWFKNNKNKIKGDIRRAMNTLMLISHRKSEKGRNVKRSFAIEQSCLKNSPNGTNQQIQSHLEQFHFIGKIIYAKRMENADPKWLKMESRLDPSIQASHSRPFPPKENVDHLIDSSPISGPLVCIGEVTHQYYNKKL